MSQTYEDYMRCGSCRAYLLDFTDRMGRKMGHCHRKQQYGQLAAHDFGCEDYLLDRGRLLPGAKVPEGAELSPRQRARRRMLEQAVERHKRGRPTRRRAPVDDEPKPKIQDIPLFGDEEDAMDREDLKELLAEVIEESLGISEVPMHKRYRGGKLIVQPGNPELSAKEIPVDVLFRKITSVRDKLRVLEQKINTNDALAQEDKASLQGYISGAYGSLTTFNFLFRDREDHFSSK